ncbi:MAG: GyrI-like domain-containing protein [Bacteroidales bacterium]|nr:GyrI-like domain-containing protein [Bacteroidales bacterium]
MNKILSLFLVVLIFAFASCKGDDKTNETDPKDSTTVESNINDEKSTIDVNVEEVKAEQMISMRSKVEMAEIGNEMGRLYGQLMTYADEKAYEMVGAPIAIYHDWTFTESDFECGLLVSGNLEPTDDIMVSETYAGKVVTAINYGAYCTVTKTWKAISAYVKENGFEENGLPWEEYITDPTMEPDTSKWETKLYQPVK